MLLCFLFIMKYMLHLWLNNEILNKMSIINNRTNIQHTDDELRKCTNSFKLVLTPI